MSLKAFHIVFVAISTLLAFFFAGWLVNNYLQTKATVALVGAIASGLAGVGLILYGKSVLRKLKQISYL
jgi:DNA-binding transcriptional regulator of glucitol operon